MKKLVFAALSAAVLCACATPRTDLGTSLIAITKQPTLATAERGTKVGKACGKNYLGIFSTGDMSIAAAKKNGRINKVSTVDRDIKGYAVYAEVCTIVTGN